MTGRRARIAGAIAAGALAVSVATSTVAAQRASIPACDGGGIGHARVAPRVDAVLVYERCLGTDRVAAIVLWRARLPGWSAGPDAVAFDQRARTLVVTARDGAHSISLGRTDSVMVAMLDYVEAVAGPIPLQTTRLAPARASGIVPPTPGAAAPQGVADSLRTLLFRNGRSRHFLGE